MQPPYYRNGLSLSTNYINLFLIAALVISLNFVIGFQALSAQPEPQGSTEPQTAQRLPGSNAPLELEASPQPRDLSEEQKAQFARGVNMTETVPDIPISSEPVPGPENGTETVANVTQSNITSTSVAGTDVINTASLEAVPITDKPSLEVIENRSFSPGGGSLSYTMETSLANKDNLIFYTGNWFATRSVDGGLTWGYIDPTQGFEDFCCDQDVIYDPNREIFIWYRQGSEQPENPLSLWSSSDTFEWFPRYEFRASDINASWAGQFSDYPSLALTEEYLYISMNMFTDSGFLRPVMLRISLEDLASRSGIGPAYEYYIDETLPPESHTFTPVQGANSSMYWGVHLSTSQMRLYEWADSEGPSSVQSFDRDVPPWTLLTRGDGECTGPVDQNWCARGQSKIRGAFMANDIIGFFWDTAKGGLSENGATFPYPYINAATFDTTNNMTYVGRPYLWSPTFAWMYGFGSPDDQGNVAIQAVYGGGPHSPSVAAGVGSNFSGESSPWNMIQVANGTNGPTLTSSSRPSWGDYIRIRPYSGEGPGWIGSGWALSGGATPEFLVPYYFEFALTGNNATASQSPVGLASDPFLPKDLKKMNFSTDNLRISGD